MLTLTNVMFFVVLSIVMYMCYARGYVKGLKVATKTNIDLVNMTILDMIASGYARGHIENGMLILYKYEKDENKDESERDLSEEEKD